MIRPGLILALSVGLVLPVTGIDNPAELFQAIRNNRLDVLKNNLSRANVETRDARGATLLMHAAAYGTIESMRMLLDAGADVNAANDFNATALLWCARDAAKARLLIEHGANVNIQSKQGRTPLMLAALRDGGSDIVALLLAKGADVKAKDNRGDTALGLAAETGDAAIMRLLLDKGADVNGRNRKGETPLIQAATSARPEAVRLLLQRGVDVNAATTWYPSVKNGQVALLKLTALHHAATEGPLEMVRDLLDASAKVNAQDSRGFTPLTLAIAADHQDAGIIRLLIERGADVNSRATTGETPLDWAEKFGFPQAVDLLNKAGAKQGVAYHPPAPPKSAPLEPAKAMSDSIALLQKTSAEFFLQGGCVGCHHQPLIAQAQASAKMAGLTIQEDLAREQLAQLKSQWASSQEEFLQSINPGGGPNRLGENLLGLNASGYRADTITDSAVIDLAESQLTGGIFPSGEAGMRPPITEGTIGSTARAIRALQVYSIPGRAAEFTARIARAEKWLERAIPVSTDDFTMRLLGLHYAGASEAMVRESAQALLKRQAKDGGWSGNPYLQSDAYSTSKALYALHESGVQATDRAYQRGVDYLLSTQYPDGSWYVRSRAIKLQPYFQSGFPYDHDQWISTAATAWAVMAIAPAVNVARTAQVR
jgi:ankyrin repeat protein